jgi:hypothetical protein
MSRRFQSCLVVLSILLLISTAYAQFGASLQGTVMDKTGAVIPGAKITATQQETGVSRETVSSGEGFYRIGGLPPGKYKIVIEAPTFGTMATKDVLVSAEAIRSFDVTLQAKQNTQTVEVTDTVTGVQTESANISANITAEEVTKLPSSGRNPYDLVRMAPGVFGDASRASNGTAVGLVNNSGPNGSATSIFQTENQVQVSGGGQRVSGNSYEVDGVSVNSLEWGGAAILTPNLESIKEVSVTVGSYSAEDGRNAGVQVKVISQTGTNTWHGSGLFKDDEPGFNAYARWGGPNGAAPQRDNDKNHTWAGSIGGPIMKDKLFFFFSYEGLRQSNTIFSQQWVLTPQYMQSIQSLRSGTPIATILGSPGYTPRVSQVLTPSCSGFSAGTCAIAGGGLDLGSITGTYGNYVEVYNAPPTGGGLDGVPDVELANIASPSKKSGNQYNARLDFAHGYDTFAVSAYLTQLNTTSANASTGSMPSADVNMRPLTPLITLLWNRTISPTWLNEARFNFSRWAFNQVSSNAGVDWGLPHVQVEDLQSLPRLQIGADRSEGTPGIFAQNQFEFRDVVSHVIGQHAFRAGGEFRMEQDNNNLLGGARPLYSFATLWNVANGTPIYEAINADPRTGGPASAQLYFRSKDIGLFLQDEWRVRHNLSLSLGLRWEYFAPLSDAHGQIANLDLGAGPGLTTAAIKLGGTLTKPDKNNFAPRFGFNWTPTSDQKMVVRGGFGVSYNRIPNSLFENTHGNPPLFARYGLCCGTSALDWGQPFAQGMTFVVGSNNSPASYPINPNLAQGINPATNLPNAGGVEIWSASPNMRTPYVFQYSLETEYQFPARTIVTLGYQGGAAHKLIRIVNQNFLQPSPTYLNPAISQDYLPMGDVNSNFNSLNIAARSTIAHDLRFDAKYRWSKSLDTLSNEGPGAQTNQTYPINQKYEYGPSDFDATHFVVGSIMYDLPFYKAHKDGLGLLLGGWAVSGIYTWHSGFPWTPVTYTQSLNLPSNISLGPIRPIGYTGTAGNSASTSTFLLPNGNFPNPGANGANYFTLGPISPTVPPGIGRNSFRGPRYSSFDMTIGKNFALGAAHLPERANLDLRLNLFNVFNKLNLNDFGYATSSDLVESSSFGQASGAKAGRVAEIQARFSF